MARVLQTSKKTISATEIRETFFQLNRLHIAGSVVVYMYTMQIRSTQLRDPVAFAIEGVPWGKPFEVPSAAYWGFLTDRKRHDPRYWPSRQRRTLLEQAAFCLLGGYGMPAEAGIAAFKAVAAAGLLKRGVTALQIEHVLRRPLPFAGRDYRYRFPRQKARYLATLVDVLIDIVPSSDALSLRDVLLSVPGLGYKTASWIVREWMDSDSVAIIDIHIERACKAIGVFQLEHTPAKNYLQMESRFLDFAHALDVRPAVLDNIMWETMRSEGAVLGVA